MPFTHLSEEQTCIPINSTELVDLNRFLLSAKLIELIQFLFQVSWLVTESICFLKVGDWVDWLWGTGIIDSIELMQNIPKKVNEIPKKGQRNGRLSKKGQNIYWTDWLIWLNHLSHSFDVIESIHMYLLTWLTCAVAEGEAVDCPLPPRFFRDN